MRLSLLIFVVGLHSGLAQSPWNGPQITQTKEYSAKQHVVAPSHTASAADPTVDALYYRLDLRLNIPSTTLQGVITVRVRVVADSTNALSLDLSESMVLDSVRMNGQRVITIRFPQSFSIQLPRSFRKGELVTAEITYHGTPNATGFGSFYFASLPGGPWVWSLSEPYGARDWWPCRDHPMDKADSVDILITCPTGLRVGSNGRLMAVHDNGDGTSTHFWSERYPIATYLVSIAVSNFAAFSNWFVFSPTDSMEILNYVLPEHLALAQQQLPKTADMLRIFSTLFGAYPFLKEKYGHSEFGRGGAMEHQTMTSTTTFDEDVLSHELAHQWFGDLITCATWQDLWLNEGFATYSESLYREARYGTSEYWRLIKERMTSAKSAKGSVFRIDTTSVANLFAVEGVYAKGASVLHMLRHVVGDSAFFRILRTYCADTRFRYGTASTADFQGVCEAVAGKPLGWFFNEWIYGESYPRYTLRWSAPSTGDSHRVTATIIQAPQNSNPSFFQMPVDLRFSGAGRDTTIPVFNSKINETFELLIPFRPDRADIDPDGWILREILVPESLFPETAQLDQNYPNPFNAGTTLTIRLPGRIHAAVRIYDLLGRRVATISDGIQEPGAHTLRWEGTDGAGQPVASGVYVVRLETTETTIARRLLLLR
jgi:aminopeptidase N